MKNKKLAIVCFTAQGNALAEKILKYREDGIFSSDWEGEVAYRPIPFRKWLQAYFQQLDALIFIGAMGIIVREMAPFLKSKVTDPAVVVLDEKGQFVISVLSGHLGGANELTRQLADVLHAVPVITTASDVNEKIAIDSFAKKNGLVISSMEQAKNCAAKIVAGEKVSFSCEGPVSGKVPEELLGKPSEAEFQIVVSPYRQTATENFLHLIPKAFVLGIGCKKGTAVEQIEKRIKEELEKCKIDLRSVLAIASIDLKKDEKGLLEFSEKTKIPLQFYSAAELQKAEGKFSSSKFVAQTTGVDNVCERAAFLVAKAHGIQSLTQCMVLPKSGKDGVTAAIMKIDWSVCFE